MRKILFTLSLFALVLSSCSSDSNPPVGHGFISFKVDGVLHEYTNIHVGESKTSMNDPKSILFIRGISDLNSNTYQEHFGIVPIRGAAFHNTIETSSLEIIQGSDLVLYIQRNGEELIHTFTTNSESKIVGAFNGRLYNYNSDEYIEITEGIIDIEYGSSNYTPFQGW